MTDHNQPLKGIAVLFDLDGTLIHTAPDLQATLNHVLTRYEYQPVSAEVTNEIIGDGAKAMLRAGLAHQNIELPESIIDDMFNLFLAHYEANIAIESAPFEGCEDALSRLKEAGAILAVCTNKKQHLAEAVLNALELTAYFSTIVGADSVPSRKPDAGHIYTTLERAGGAAERAIMIGDSQTDERAALNAGLPFMYVPFGYGSMSEPDNPACSTLSQFSDLSIARIIKILS